MKVKFTKLSVYSWDGKNTLKFMPGSTAVSGSHENHPQECPQNVLKQFLDLGHCKEVKTRKKASK